MYLQSSSLVNLDDIEVSVNDGVVTLKGTVDNLSHKYAIAGDIEKIHGVRSVNVSGLTVKSKKAA
jgi:osmotically-inducible protein OsmY